LSKAWALASARIGIAYASKDIVKLLNKVKMPYNISKLNQEAALKALDNEPEFKRNIEIILKEKVALINVLNSFDIVKKIYPSDSNFLLVEFEDANDTYRRLVDLKVITRNRHKLIDNCIRITVGTPDENQTLINALKEMEL
jgi:histidinol-phosphate aminotransferase